MTETLPAKPRIILLGPRGSGKSSVGRLLAERLKVSFLDLDQQIQRQALKPIARIFDEIGEAGFRELEMDALAAALAGDAGVIGTGGGVILRETSRQRLQKAHAEKVLLIADPAILWHRIRADPNTPHTRPALTSRSGEAEIRHLLEQRLLFYRQLADHELDTSIHTPAEVADEIVSLIKKG